MHRGQHAGAGHGVRRHAKFLRQRPRRDQPDSHDHVHPGDGVQGDRHGVRRVQQGPVQHVRRHGGDFVHRRTGALGGWRPNGAASVSHPSRVEADSQLDFAAELPLHHLPHRDGARELHLHRRVDHLHLCAAWHAVVWG